MTANNTPNQSPKLKPTITHRLDGALQKVTRRHLLACFAASSGAILLGHFRFGKDGNSAERPTFLSPTPIAHTTLVLTPTSFPIATASATQQPTLATVAPLNLTSTPTATPVSQIFLPEASSSSAVTLTSPAYPPPQTQVAQQPFTYPVATATSTVTPLPTATPIPSLTPTMPATSTPSPTNTPTPTATPIPVCIDPADPPPETDAPRFGLHASADPTISDDERCMFNELRPSLIKVLTFHPPPDLAKLIQSQPYPEWIVRTFLSFGGRTISPADFVRFTLDDTQRTVRLLDGFDVVVEIHNEPNLVAEGLSDSWQDGEAFGIWWRDVLAQYRAAIPTVRFIYPGLSPGPDVPDIRQAHIDFIEQSRSAVDAADGLGVHLYWSAASPMSDALATLDDYITRFPNKPIWITEASYNTGGIDEVERARQYLMFADSLRLRPAVQGVTFFVASASNPTFADEAWLGTGLAARLGQRDQ